MGNVISIIIQLIGIIGAYKEQFCMSLTYAILMALGTLYCVLPALFSPLSWIYVVLYLSICVLACVLANDIRKARRATTQVQWIAGEGNPSNLPYPTQPSLTS